MFHQHVIPTSVSAIHAIFYQIVSFLSQSPLYHCVQEFNTVPRLELYVSSEHISLNLYNKGVLSENIRLIHTA